MLESTKLRLKQWGDWVRSGGHNLGYSSVRMNAPSGGCDVPDDQAMQVDQAVACLKRQEPALGKALMRHYVQGWDYTMVGEEIGKSRDQVRVLLRSAEAWVDGRLFE
ncbi:antiterminator Q family protein [Marinobacter sp. M1N3S26]|uniref:antiterminator Q family protein n=1 Tax=Marinobacter sp. M1N3S26 TaxID=3382299 RepID=UPI00387B24EE